MDHINQKPDLRWVERLTRLMDSKYKLPGTRFRFGLDPIIGLVPFLGDAVSFGVSSVMMLTMWKYGASGRVKALMLVNVLLDLTIGAIPVIGGIFDFFYKSNERNLRLLRQHFEEGRHQGSGTPVIIALVLLILAIIAVLVYLIILLIHWIF